MLKGIELKKFREIEGHGDSRTFEADIWMDGKKIGHTGNNGWGGPNEYHFWDGEKRNDKAEKEFLKRAKEYLTENKKMFPEDPDMFVEDLIEHREFDKIKRKNEKAGYPFTVLCKKKGSYIKEMDYTTYGEQWFVGFRSKEDIESYLKKEKVEAYQVLI